MPFRPPSAHASENAQAGGSSYAFLIRTTSLCDARPIPQLPPVTISLKALFVHTSSLSVDGFLVLRESVIRIAIQPTLTRFCRCNHGMPARSRVFSGMLVWRVVAAQSRAAFLTGPQMDPLCIDLHTLRALAALSVFDRRNRFKMRTSNTSHNLPFIRAGPCVRRRLQSIPHPPLMPRA